MIILGYTESTSHDGEDMGRRECRTVITFEYFALSTMQRSTRYVLHAIHIHYRAWTAWTSERQLRDTRKVRWTAFLTPSIVYSKRHLQRPLLQ
jgi:hypothetical protein